MYETWHQRQPTTRVVMINTYKIEEHQDGLQQLNHIWFYQYSESTFVNERELHHLLHRDQINGWNDSINTQNLHLLFSSLCIHLTFKLIFSFHVTIMIIQHRYHFACLSVNYLLFTGFHYQNYILWIFFNQLIISMFLIALLLLLLLLLLLFMFSIEDGLVFGFESNSTNMATYCLMCASSCPSTKSTSAGQIFFNV